MPLEFKDFLSNISGITTIIWDSPKDLIVLKQHLNHLTNVIVLDYDCKMYKQNAINSSKTPGMLDILNATTTKKYFRTLLAKQQDYVVFIKKGLGSPGAIISSTDVLIAKHSASFVELSFHKSAEFDTSYKMHIKNKIKENLDIVLGLK